MPRTTHPARRALLVCGAVVMTAVVAFGLAGLFLAARGQSTLAHDIRPAASPLPPVQVNASPSWSFDAGGSGWHELSIRAQEVPMQLDSGAPAASGVATVYLDAEAGHFDGEELTVTSGTVRIELGAQALGTPLGLCSAFLSAADDGSLIGPPSQRARISGRLLAPEAGADHGAAANAGTCTDASASFGMELRTERDAASAVIGGQDLSAAGRRLSENVPGASDAVSDWPGLRPEAGDALKFGADSMPLGLAPETTWARAHSVWLQAEFDELRFSPRELVADLTFGRHSPRG